jgi:proteasome lid subunit RPN8/RPN11
MAHNNYHYVIDFFRDDGTAIAQVPVIADWMPALEWTHFDAVRHGQLPALTEVGLASRGTVEPVWHPQSGKPHVAGWRVEIAAHGTRVERAIPSSYFRALAQQASGGLIDKGVLQQGDVFRYLVTAFPTSPASIAAPPAQGLVIEEIEQPLPLDDQSLDAFFAGAVAAGPQPLNGDMPVFCPRRVLDEALVLARAAGDIETGGVLVGNLHRDTSVPEIFVEISAQIPALHTESASAKLTFTAETWAAARAAITLRKRGETMISWWHSHPDFCRIRQCPIERRKECTATTPFLSSEDVHLHATCFGRAYQTALLISDSTAAGLTCSLFGWRHGMVLPRGFHILHDDHPKE